jgi:hypothetical protein
MAVWACVVVGLLHHTGVWATASRLAVICGMVGAVAVLAGAWVAGEAITRRAVAQAEHLAAETARRRLDAAYHDVQQRCQHVRGEIARTLDELHRVGEALRRGEVPSPGGAAIRATDSADPFEQVAHDVCRLGVAARQKVIDVATMMSADQQAQLRGASADEGAPREADGVTDGESARVDLRMGDLRMGDLRMDVVGTLSLRLQALVHRALLLLSEIQARVEDPDLLAGLYGVDHLVVLVRRQAENLAVIGGGDPRRLWTSPVSITSTVRSAVQEIEHYSRVKMVRPVEGTLRGDVVADLIHLLAELVENATEFCPARLVWIRVEEVPAGLAIEIEDRGVGFARDAERRRMNELLAEPGRVSLDELLRDGRIGLWVVAVLARRHGVAVELKSNLFGGVTAAVVVPHDLVEVAVAHHQTTAGHTTAAATPAGTVEAAAMPTERQIDVPHVDGQVLSAAAPRAPSRAPSAGGERPTDGRHPPAGRSSRLGLPGTVDARARHALTDLDRPVTEPTSGGVLSSRHADEHSAASSMSGASSENKGSSEPPPLPQRVRLQHLAPQLREPPPPENGGTDADADGGAAGSEVGGAAGDSALDFTEGLLGGFRDTDPSSVTSSGGDQPA